MRDRDYEEDTATMPEQTEELPLRYILFVGYEYEQKGGAEDCYSFHVNLLDAADQGERLYLKGDCDWFNVLDFETGRQYNNEHLAKLTSERNHREAVERVRAYKTNLGDSPDCLT